MNLRPFTRSESFSLICACGECGVEPETWECESKDDAEAKADAYRTLSNLAERRGRAAEAVRLAGLADALAPFRPL